MFIPEPQDAPATLPVFGIGCRRAAAAAAAAAAAEAGACSDVGMQAPPPGSQRARRCFRRGYRPVLPRVVLTRLGPMAR